MSKTELKANTNIIISGCLLLFCLATAVKIYGSLKIIPFSLTHNFEAAHSSIMSSNLDLGLIEIIQVSSLFILVKKVYQSKKGIFLRLEIV